MASSSPAFQRLIEKDPWLEPYGSVLARREANVRQTRQRLTNGNSNLVDFAVGHDYFGLHLHKDQWIFREWAPYATSVYLIGEMTGWQEKEAFALNRINPTADEAGQWEIRLPVETMSHGDLYRLRLHWPGGGGDRIPAWARRVVQDPHTNIFNAQVWQPPEPYQWRQTDFTPAGEAPFIYEVHIGMAQEEGKVGSFAEFTEKVLPRVVRSGYNTLQLMAIQEHPYYASFGYQVSSFFAPSSRFGAPEDLKALIDAAHGAGLTVIMDIVHSHAVANEVEGLSRFDGTGYQYFHSGARGTHSAWNSRCFDYAKPEVIHFLLSNCRYWLDEYNIDGFRFDGITSMLYLDHGLEKVFTSYDDYFNDQVDEDALTYLTLANELIHHIKPKAITIAEDVSGMPGLVVSQIDGGIGFDYRFAMGIPDYWIRLVKEKKDEEWSVGELWHELTQRRAEEKTISYAESHDQALVGDQTLMFRLGGVDMYGHMHVEDRHLNIDRATALHKMIRLITLATAGNGYLNFMGNEFGHPEWIDFPREGNAWSFHYSRRQWHLADDPQLKYQQLADFDRAMITLARRYGWLESLQTELRVDHRADQILIFKRGDFLFGFNFHPEKSFADYPVDIAAGQYRLLLDTDDARYGGHQRLVPKQLHQTLIIEHNNHSQHCLRLYLPSRTGFVLNKERE